MKKILVIVFLLASLVSFGQPTNYTKIEQRYNWLAGYFRALHAPSGTTVGLQTNQWPGAGALYVDTAGADSGFYYRGPNAVWHRLAKASEFSGNSNIGSGFRWAVPNTYNIKTFFGAYGLTVDSSTNTNAITAKADTSIGSGLLSWPRWLKIRDSLGTVFGSSGITVGTTTITSGTDTRVPFNDGGVYNEDAGFTYDKTANQLDAPNVNIPFGGKINVARIDMAGSVSLSIRNGGGAELANWDHTSGLFYQQYPAKFDNYLDVKEISDPSTPAAGYTRGFAKNNGLYNKDEAGAVTKLNEQQVRSLTVEVPSSSENISFFYTDKAITITKAAYAVRGSSPSVTIDVHHHTDRSSGSPNELFGTNVAVTSTTGTTNTSFNDATIPAGSYVWLITSATSGTNNEITITLTFTED